MNEIAQKLEAYYDSFLKSIPRIALAIFILIIGILAANWFTSLFQKRINKKSHNQ